MAWGSATGIGVVGEGRDRGDGRGGRDRVMGEERVTGGVGEEEVGDDAEGEDPRGREVERGERRER